MVYATFGRTASPLRLLRLKRRVFLLPLSQVLIVKQLGQKRDSHLQRSVKLSGNVSFLFPVLWSDLFHVLGPRGAKRDKVIICHCFQAKPRKAMEQEGTSCVSQQN